MTLNNPHGNALLGDEHSAANGVFVHPLYGPVQLNGDGPCTSHTGSVHILEIDLAHCTIGVRLWTSLMAMHQIEVNTLPPTELLYTRCADL